MKVLGYMRNEIVAYSIASILAIALAYRLEEIVNLNLWSLLSLIMSFVIFLISNKIVYNWIIDFLNAKSKEIKILRLSSMFFTYVAFATYFGFCIVVLIGTLSIELGGMIVAIPIILNMILQDYMYFDEGNVILLNKRIKLEDIKIVRVEKAIPYSYNIYMNIMQKETPVSFSISRKYLENIKEAIAKQGLTIEADD